MGRSRENGGRRGARKPGIQTFLQVDEKVSNSAETEIASRGETRKGKHDPRER